jgi:hypothetical protein
MQTESGSDCSEVPNIHRLTFLTSDRPEALERGLSSYIRNAQEFGRKCLFQVLDDSRDEQVRNRCGRVTEGLRAQFGVAIDHVTRADRAAFADRLSHASGVPRPLVEFAVLGHEDLGRTTGANRNTSLLLSAGHMFFSADDDTVCRTFEPISQQNQLRISAEAQPTRVWALDSTKSARVRECPQDLLGLHESYLGRSVRSVLAERPPTSVELQSLPPEFVRSINDFSAQVRLSWTGILGDSGFSSPGYLLFLDGEEREYLVADPEAYRRYVSNRNVLRIPSTTTITPGGFFQSVAIALDHREILPPFMPIFRGQDILFGEVVKATVPQACTVYLPKAVVHQPWETRVSQAGALWEDVGRWGFFQLLRAMVSTFSSGSYRTTDDSLNALARHLRECSRMHSRDFGQWMDFERKRILSITAIRLRTLLNKHGSQPVHWAKDVENRIRETELVLKKSGPAAPTECLAGKDLERAIPLTARLAREYADLLEAWPALVRASRNVS